MMMTMHDPRFSFSIPSEVAQALEDTGVIISPEVERDMPGTHNYIADSGTIPFRNPFEGPASPPRSRTILPSSAKIERFKSAGGDKVLEILRFQSEDLSYEDVEFLDRLTKLSRESGHSIMVLGASYSKMKGFDHSHLDTNTYKIVNNIATNLSEIDIAYLDGAYA